MDIYFINKMIIKYQIDFNYAESIYLDLYNKGLIDQALKDIDEIETIEKFIRKYYKEIF